ncbi:hypothetical protein FRC00_001847 [Tulasnella sp. 408]|nr:hypothetical protein FRC00_001847 [Tulasnella sp. 408]
MNDSPTPADSLSDFHIEHSEAEGIRTSRRAVSFTGSVASDGLNGSVSPTYSTRISGATAAAYYKLKAKHDTDVAQMREQAAALNREKSDLQASVNNLKTEMAKRERMIGKNRFGSPLANNNPPAEVSTPTNYHHDEDLFASALASARKLDAPGSAFLTSSLRLTLRRVWQLTQRRRPCFRRAKLWPRRMCRPTLSRRRSGHVVHVFRWHRHPNSSDPRGS